MKHAVALFAALFIGCTETKDAETTEFERDVGDYLDRGNLVVVSSTIDKRIKARGVDKVAPLVVEPILTKWANVEKSELENAATLGKDRALGRGKDHCEYCVVFRKTLDVLAPASPELDTRWKALKPKLEQAETAAYDTEMNDKRPIVVVWQRGSGGSNAAVELISLCFKESLQKAFPNYKWLLESEAPKREVAQFEVTGKSAIDTYVDSHTNKEAAKLLSGLRIVITPHNLDSTLASRFAAPLEAKSEVNSPDTIRSDLPVGGPPTVEAMRAGMDQIGKIQDHICSTLSREVQKAAASETAAPASSQKK